MLQVIRGVLGGPGASSSPGIGWSSRPFLWEAGLGRGPRAEGSSALTSTDSFQWRRGGVSSLSAGALLTVWGEQRQGDQREAEREILLTKLADLERENSLIQQQYKEISEQLKSLKDSISLLIK